MSIAERHMPSQPVQGTTYKEYLREMCIYSDFKENQFTKVGIKVTAQMKSELC